MSNCSDPYNNVCRQDIPYPQVSPESVPSLIDNLVTALYGSFYNPQTGTGFITKSVVNGRVVWNIACDPQNNPADVPTIPRLPGEGTLCYLLRIFELTVPQYALGVPQGGLRWSLAGNDVATTLSLTGAVSTSTTAYIVSVGGVIQDPSSYTLNTASLPYTLVMPAPIPTGVDLVAVSINSPVAGWYSASGVPNGLITAPVGSIYTNTSGGANQTLWVKESGSGNTGWVAK
jgi:hypothetical protein